MRVSDALLQSQVDGREQGKWESFQQLTKPVCPLGLCQCCSFFDPLHQAAKHCDMKVTCQRMEVVEMKSRSSELD